MRLLTTLTAAGLVCVAAGAPERSYRKSLGFGPVHPHAVFRSGEIPQDSLFTAEANPLHVARAFVVDLVGDALDDTKRFVLRKDSYTDKATGVTHAYFRQLVNDVQVVDGDISVNVKDGVVISYGDSFYRGPTPDWWAKSDKVADPHAEYCSTLLQHQSAFSSSNAQVTLGSDREGGDPELLSALYESNCGGREVVASLHEGFTEASAQTALLAFMALATPSEDVKADIVDNFATHLEGMKSEYEMSFTAGDVGGPVERISNVPGTVNPVKAMPAYVQVPNGDKTMLEFVWKFEVEMADNWYEAAVSAAAPHRVISVVDWASDAYAPVPKKGKTPSYNVFAWGINDPSEGNRTLVKDEPDKLASPAGWHAMPVANDPKMQGVRRANGAKWSNYTTTFGNNVFAHENWEGRNDWIDNYRPTADGDVYDFPYDPQDAEAGEDALREAKKYINATVTQLFYTSNMVHDLYYRYGFDEVSGNFQQHNFGRGGEENDAVIANAQDGSGYNNANFMTPPDGQNGRCRMYLWNTANPYRDGDLEAGIVIHELSHGLSTRLTGGPANSGCLGWGESGGMGEGWGDYLATAIRSKKEYADYPMGEWAANRVGGIRNFPYSLNETVNPSTYKTLDKPGYWGVHAIGEVWAEMLWVVSQKMIAKHGFAEDLFPPAEGGEDVAGYYRADAPGVPAHGNTLMVQLVLNGMKLQPCRPSFFDARDAIIQADQVLTGGENFCELWKGFGERGLGPDARVEGRTPWGGGIRTNDYAVPLACKEEKIPEKPEEPEDDDEDYVLEFII